MPNNNQIFTIQFSTTHVKMFSQQNQNKHLVKHYGRYEVNWLYLRELKEKYLQLSSNLC